MKFGVFIVITVSLALIWGLLFFPGLLHIFGPSGNTGEIFTFAKKVLPCFGKKPEEMKPPESTGNETARNEIA